MDRLVELNTKLVEISRWSGAPGFVKALARLPVMERMVAEMAQIFFMRPVECGSYDLVPPERRAELMY